MILQQIQLSIGSVVVMFSTLTSIASITLFIWAYQKRIKNTVTMEDVKNVYKYVDKETASIRVDMDKHERRNDQVMDSINKKLDMILESMINHNGNNGK